MRVPSSVWTAAGIIGGYAVARATKRRELGGIVLAGCGTAAYREWHRTSGPRTAAALSAAYLAAFGLSHPLAKRLGAWPSVLTVTAATAAAAHVCADRRDGAAVRG